MTDLHLHSLTETKSGSFTLSDSGPAILGRGQNTRFPVIDANVSREHASLVLRGGQWFVTDLGSRHGTELNGVRLEGHSLVPLADGDRLRIGGVAEYLVAFRRPESASSGDTGGGPDRLETLSVLRQVEIEAPRLLSAAIELPRELNRAENESGLYAIACRFLTRSLGDVLRSTNIVIAPVEKGQKIEVLARDAPIGSAARPAAPSDEVPLSRRVVREAVRRRGSIVCLHRRAGPSAFAATVPDAVQTVAATLIEYAADGRPIVLYALGEQKISSGQQWVADFIGLVAELTRQHLLLLRRSRLCKYFSPSVVSMMMKRGALESVEREPKRMEATTMFFDLRGFSLASDGGIDDMLAVHADLQQVMSIVTEEVFSSEGAVLDYHGDGLQAAWGVPIPQVDQAARAVSCARSILARLATTDLLVFRSAKETGRAPCGIGIDRGEVLAGPVGSREQFKYGILGGSVNRASRLESLTKSSALDAPILITAAVHEGLDARGPRTRRVGRVQPAGMRGDMDVYEVLTEDAGDDDGVSDREVGLWHECLRRLEGARTSADLETIRGNSAALPPDDRRTNWLRRQLASLSAPERLVAWDGVIRFEAK